MTPQDRFPQIAAQLKRLPLSGFVGQIWTSFQADRCSHSAAALTYMSLFAVVPLLTVLFAMLSAIPAFGQADTQIQQLVFSHFLPSSGEDIQGYLLKFSEQARHLTGIGIAFLAITALTMLMKIEQEFNVIWRAHRNRSGLSSFLRYWAILSLGPLCIGLAIGISTYLASLHVLFDQVDLFGVRKFALVVAPYVLTAIAFTLLFAVIPNARVAIGDAAIGGLASALCFELAKYIFARVVANASYQFIYGTFAAIPLFLLWIYISWMIVLAGAEIAHAMANYGGRSSKLPDLIAALGVLEILWRKYQSGARLNERELLQRHSLFGHCTLSTEQWEHLRNVLLEAGLIRDAVGGEFVLARNLQRYALWELVELFDKSPPLTENCPSNSPQWLQTLQHRFAQLCEYRRTQLQMPLTAIFEGDNTCEDATSPREHSPAA